MYYKALQPGEICQFFDGSRLIVCLKVTTGDAVILASGEIIHIHPTRKVETVQPSPGGRLATVKDRPCIVFPLSPGRMIAGYYMIVEREAVPEHLVNYGKSEAKLGEMSKEVDIMLSGYMLMLRKVLKLLGGQADTLESLLEVDIMQADKMMGTSRYEQPEKSDRAG